MLTGFKTRLIKGKGAYASITPSPIMALNIPYKGIVLMSYSLVKSSIKLVKGKTTLEEVGGEFIAGQLLSSIKVPLTTVFKRGILAAQLKSSPFTLLMGDYEKRNDGRIIRPVRIMYHDAYKAGKHLDVHIGRTSLIYRVSGKPVEALIKYNNKGELTQTSKDALLDHIKYETAKRARVPQNLDHTVSNAKCQWFYGKDSGYGEPGSYGSGMTRQLVAESKAEFYHHKVRTSEHMYCPLINPDQGLYIYKIYDGSETGNPILIWGNLIPLDENSFQDRLHLKLIQPEAMNDYKNKIDITTNTRKYDGASCYFTSNGQGFKVFSPRFSKVTGHRIEYTYKLPEMAETGSKYSPQGMGELLFWKKTPLGMVLSIISNTRGIEGISWKYLKSTEIGGVLNSNSLRPTYIYPEIRVYRIDRFKGVESPSSLPFFDNRFLQLKMVKELNQKFWKVVSFDQSFKKKGWEGFVGVPEGKSINDGYKIKFWGDEYDWEIIENKLSISPKGNVQGVINFRSLDSNREFALGPGQIGSFDECMYCIEEADNIIGKVAKVHGREGHEGRAAKLISWHLDK
jgi:hypothetical protein